MGVVVGRIEMKAIIAVIFCVAIAACHAASSPLEHDLEKLEHDVALLHTKASLRTGAASDWVTPNDFRLGSRTSSADMRNIIAELEKGTGDKNAFKDLVVFSTGRDHGKKFSDLNEWANVGNTFPEIVKFISEFLVKGNKASFATVVKIRKKALNTQQKQHDYCDYVHAHDGDGTLTGEHLNSNGFDMTLRNVAKNLGIVQDAHGNAANSNKKKVQAVLGQNIANDNYTPNQVTQCKVLVPKALKDGADIDAHGVALGIADYALRGITKHYRDAKVAATIANCNAGCQASLKDQLDLWCGIIQDPMAKQLYDDIHGKCGGHNEGDTINDCANIVADNNLIALVCGNTGTTVARFKTAIDA